MEPNRANYNRFLWWKVTDSVGPVTYRMSWWHRLQVLILENVVVFELDWFELLLSHQQWHHNTHFVFECFLKSTYNPETHFFWEVLFGRSHWSVVAMWPAMCCKARVIKAMAANRSCLWGNANKLESLYHPPQLTVLVQNLKHIRRKSQLRQFVLCDLETYNGIGRKMGNLQHWQVSQENNDGWQLKTDGNDEQWCGATEWKTSNTSRKGFCLQTEDELAIEAHGIINMKWSIH